MKNHTTRVFVNFHREREPSGWSDREATPLTKFILHITEGAAGWLSCLPMRGKKRRAIIPHSTLLHGSIEPSQLFRHGNFWPKETTGKGRINKGHDK